MKYIDSFNMFLIGIFALVSGYQINSMKSEINQLKQKVEILEASCQKEIKK